MRSVRCLVAWHTFRIARTEDNEPFRRCVRCGKVLDGTPRPGDAAGAGYSQPML